MRLKAAVLGVMGLLIATMARAQTIPFNFQSQSGFVSAGQLDSNFSFLQNAANLTGTLPPGRLPAFSGDCTTTAGASSLVCLKTNGLPFTSAATTSIGTSGAVIPLLNGANTWGARQIVQIPDGPFSTAFSSLEGSMSGSNSSGYVNLNNISIGQATSENITQTAAGSLGFVNGLAVYHNYGGSAAQGGRQSLYVQSILTAPTSSSNANRNYVAIQTLADANSGDGGTSAASQATSKGALFGFGSAATASSGATALANITGAEFDVSIATGGSAWYKSGLQIAALPTDAVHGTVEAELSLSLQPGAVGWNNGIMFDNWNGAFPVVSTGTLIGSDGNGTAANGVDFSNTTFTGCAFKSKNLCTGPTGISATANLNGSLPSTCANPGYFLGANYGNGTAGPAEMDLVNCFTTGNGFSLLQMTATGVATPVLTADKHGFVSAAAFAGNASMTISPGGITVIGTGGTVVCSAGHVCDQFNGELTVTTGTGISAAGNIVELSLPVSRNNDANCIVTLNGGTTFIPLTILDDAQNNVFIQNVGTNLAVSSSYRIHYVCAGN